MSSEHPEDAEPPTPDSSRQSSASPDAGNVERADAGGAPTPPVVARDSAGRTEHTAQGRRAEPPAEIVTAAAANPGSWLPEIAGTWPAGADVPPTGIVGAWEIGADGAATGWFEPNPGYDAEAAAGARLAVTDPETGQRIYIGKDVEPCDSYGRMDLPAIIVVHGGFWRPGVARRSLRALAHRLGNVGGTWALLADYALRPGDPEAPLRDLAEIAANLPGTPLWLGHGAGAQLALIMAMRTGGGAVALAPITDLVAAERDGLGDGAVAEFLGAPYGPDTAERYHRYSPDRAAGTQGEAGPIVIVHGTADTVVPVEQSRSVSLRPQDRYLELAGAHHYDVVDPASPFFEDMVFAITRRERPSA